MTSETIFRNIYSYLEVLEVANTEKVSQWTSESLENATRWGSYCEQVFTQSKGKPYADDLDKYIRRFNQRPWSLGGTVIHLGFLEKASQHILNALLQNPCLSSNLYSVVMKTYIDSAGKENFIQVCSNLSQTKAALEVAQVIESRLNPSTRSPSSQNVTENEGNEETEALLLYRYLKHTINHAAWDHRTESNIEGKLENIGSSSTGLMVLLRCLQHIDKSEEGQGRYGDVRNLLIRQICGVMDRDIENKSICTLPPDLLTWGAAADMAIFSSLMRRLVVEAENMSVEFDPCVLRMTWKRNSASVGLSYDKLVKLLQDLRSVSEDLAKAVDGILEDLSETNDNEVWRSLIKDIKRRHFNNI